MRLCVLLFCVFAAVAGPAWADDFDLPGVQNDANHYLSGLTGRFPAGGSGAARAAAEQQAAAAIQRKDWAAATAALEQRLALGQSSAQNDLDLARAQLRRVPPTVPPHCTPRGWDFRPPTPVPGKCRSCC